MTQTILIAGFQHETNTFAPSKAAYENFARGEGHPAMPRGAAMLELRDVNLPAGGFIRAAEAEGWALVPVLWAGASPSAHVSADAYERIAGEIVAAVERGGFDAVYLDLHGAMVSENFDDGEGELLARVRRAVGPAIPVVASLDLHANVTERMLANADALVAYRTYPHVDMAETGARAAALLKTLFERGGQRGGESGGESGNPRGASLARAVRRLPFLIPINGMCTLLEPSRSMYALLGEHEQGAVRSLSFAPGFPAADFPECGPVIWGYGDTPEAAEAAVGALYERMLADEAQWQVPFLAPDAAVAEAQRLAADASHAKTGPVVIADTQDNPGAGADSNTAGMLRALVNANAQDAAMGLFFDPQAAAAAHAAGVGATLALSLGGKSGVPGDTPFEGNFEVVALSDGRCRYDGPMMHGMQVEMGPVACLRIGGVLLAVSSTKAQMLDRNLYRVAGIEPERMKILVNKSSVHFRADFEPIARAVLVAKAPGPMTADPADLPWKHLKPGIRLRPRGPAFAG
ncbi:M81 family metallopeptidase [Paraburkholderia acidisoli]|uniref:Microcystinase C n=1 Tax=Paraburkholderia acidisoli TaxID=2571748 RepID=A0A7Z2JIE2_9BURK|nr:M81 family metallopeptidase [Paraburkholderia acidisoli]QGZ65616.1 microcystin degradation protein MlrC [Paraburkholderia acidisoli]